MQASSQKRENIKTTILAILLTHKTGCTLKQLCDDYYELEGENVPWKELGYVSLLNFLNSMQESVYIERQNNVTILKGIASDKSAHVSKLVAGQKTQKYCPKRKLYKPSHYYPNTAPQRIIIPANILCKIVNFVNHYPNGISKDYVFREIQLHMTFSNITMKDMEEQLQKLSHKVYLLDNKIYPVKNKNKKLNYLENVDISFSKSKSESQNRQESKTVIITAAGSEDSSNYEDDLEFQSFNDISDFSYINSLETTKPAISSPKETNDQYDIFRHSPIIQDKQGNSHESFNNVQNQMEFLGHKGIEKENCSHKENIEILINERVKFRLEKLIQNHPDGIWCADLPYRYLEEYKVPLNYIELGFSSVREFASQLPEIFHCIQLHDNTGDFKLYHAKSGIPLNQIEKKQQVMNLSELYQIYETKEEEEALPVTVSSGTCKKLIPDEVMSMGECVGYLNVVDLVNTEVIHIEVIVIEVFTPSFFWIQLRKKQKTFKKFMDDLHKFYVMNYESFVIPPVVLEEGLNCACVYNGTWHRAIIKTVKPDFQVTVLFYDYGTLKTYPPEAIYYLHRKFSYLPAQAIPCGLINVKPCTGSKWSRNVTHLFAVKTCQIPLIATVASINIEDNSMMVTLTNTLEEEDIHINDWLVERKLAEHGKMVCMKKRNFPFRYYLECQKRFERVLKISDACKMKTKFENKAALYNLSSCERLSYNYDSTNVNENKEYFSNELIATKENNKQLQLSEPWDSRKNDISVEKGYACTQNSENKIPGRLYSSFKKLLNFKQKPTEIIAESNEFQKSNRTLTEQKLCDEEEKNNNVKSNNIKFDTLPADSAFTNEKKESDVFEKKYIMEKFRNIPKQYANHFHVQDTDDESLDISCMRNNKQNGEDEIEYIDWSIILENDTKIRTTRKNECESEKKMYKIPSETMFQKQCTTPLAENCFLNAVYNSSYFSVQDNEINWLPTGNITKGEDCTSPLILNNIIKDMKSIRNDMTIAIPKEILLMLRDEKSTESLNVPGKINHVQSTHSVQQINNPTVDNIKLVDSNGVSTKKFEKNSEDNKENNYCYMATLTSKQKLVSPQDVSSVASNLDSDDLSTAEESISIQQNIDNDEKFKTDEYKNDMVIRENVLTEPYLKIITTRLLHPVETEIENFHTDDSVINNYETCEKETLLTSFELPKEVSNEVKESDSIKSSNSTEKSVLIKETVQMEIVPVKETVIPDIIEKISNVPVFDDTDIKSDEEEWNVHISNDDVYDLLKNNLLKFL